MAKHPQRRNLFGAGAAMLLLGATEAGPAKAQELDGELLAACARFLQAEAKWRRLNDLVCAAETTFGVHAPEVGRAEAERDAHGLECHDAAAAVCLLPARTPEGLRAKAQAVFAFYQPDPPEARSIVGPAMWQLVCEVAGQPCEYGPAHPEWPAGARS
jgi:hypothetical protein